MRSTEITSEVFLPPNFVGRKLTTSSLTKSVEVFEPALFSEGRAIYTL